MQETQLFRSSLFAVTEFLCPPGDEAWRYANQIESRAPIVVFPRQPVGIRPADRPRVLATPNLVMLYNPAQEYERELRDARGDSCIYITIHEPALAALEAASDIVSDGRMAATHVPCTRDAYFQQHLLARYLASGQVDPLTVEETTWSLLGGVLEHRSPGSRRRPGTTSAHYELTEAAKDKIVESISETLSLADLGALYGSLGALMALLALWTGAFWGLADLGAQLGVSPFHLARIFRAQTGFTLHQYRKQLRLRIALVELAANRASLSALAFDLGFASHSHFTDTFRREFGVAPSAVRDGGVALAG